MRLVILGGSGAGKGTQAVRMGQRFKLSVLSTGDLIRSAIQATEERSAPDDAALTQLAQTARPYLEAGTLVPDELMIGFIRQRLLQPDMQQGWILEGYPRTAFQAEELDFLLEELGQSLTRAVWLEVPQELLVERALSRSRADDAPETIKRRIETLETHTKPLMDYYGYKKRLLLVDGAQSPDAVEAEITARLTELAQTQG